MTQAQAVKLLKSGHNIFLTGAAGTGKTFLLGKFIEYLKNKDIPAGITASTGVAATHLGGRTIHSWMGMGIERSMESRQIQKILKNKKTRERIRSAKVLIIDEISMLDADRLDLVDKICRDAKDPFLPFGGMQIVMCGDFFQLSPIDSSQKPKFAYDAESWYQADVKVCYLDKQFRHRDEKLILLLNRIRENKAGHQEVQLLKTRFEPNESKTKKAITKLYTHNIDVDAINSIELNKLSGHERIFSMTHSGLRHLVNTLKKSCLAPEVLKLKIGAMVMCVKNNFDAGYVNGTTGEVVGFNENGYPVILTKEGNEIIIAPTSWSIEEESDQNAASIRQIPLRLAWAITVHKSQGMSLDEAQIDLSKSFECGMGYVALSRVKTLQGIRLIGLNDMALRVNGDVVEKDKEFRMLSARL